MCVYVYIYIYIHISVCIHIYTYTLVHTDSIRGGSVRQPMISTRQTFLLSIETLRPFVPLQMLRTAHTPWPSTRHRISSLPMNCVFKMCSLNLLFSVCGADGTAGEVTGYKSKDTYITGMLWVCERMSGVIGAPHLWLYPPRLEWTEIIAFTISDLQLNRIKIKWFFWGGSPTGFRDVENPIFSIQSAQRWRTGCRS
jgi:hypothetical protein